MSASPPAAGSSNGGNSPEPVGQQTQLYNDIFGGDEDSDLSDDEDDRPAKRLPFPSKAAAAVAADEEDAVDEDEEDGAAAGASGSRAASPADNDDDDEADEDAYVPGDARQAAKIPKFKKVRRSRDEGDEDDAMDNDDEADRPRKKKKKRKERRERENRREAVDPEEEEAEPTYDVETQRRMALAERIDNIGKKQKPVRRKKKGEDVDIVDSYHDDICMRLRERMVTAADKDQKSNEAKMPATAKLAMLDEVMSVLRNTPLWQSIVDNGVMEAVRLWLEPIYPSGALPAVGIQKAIFEILPKMDLDTATLKESRLGPIVLFYTKTPRVTPGITRAAEALVQAWSRPIIKRPSNYRSMHIDTAADIEASANPDDLDATQSLPQTLSQGQSQGRAPRRKFDVAKALEENKGRKGARMPVVQEIQYTVAPESRLKHHLEDSEHVARIQKDNSKFNKFARQMKAGRR